MPAQKGRDFLLKIGSGVGAVTLAALTTTGFTINAETVETTNKDSAKNGTNDTYTVVFDNGDLLVGSFAVNTLEAAGEFNGAQTYNVSLESSGDVTFTQTV